MVIIFIVVGDFILKCVSVIDATTSCILVSPIVFGGFVVAGCLEAVFELKGLITIFRKKD